MITSFAPNSTAKDVLIALSYLCLPWRWFSLRTGSNAIQVEKQLEDYFGLENSVITMDSGRTALYLALKSLGVGPGDEVILQAFTCVVVPNAIKHTGATPIYADIDANSTNFDPNKLEQVITKKSRAIIVQHTFGLAADLDPILKIADKYKLKVIEDCAHSLGSEYKGKKLGTFGDASIFSFGVDKVISSVRGGALLTKEPELYKKIRASSLPKLPLKIVLKHLFHLPIFALGKTLYPFYLGKILLYLSKKIGLTALIIESKEKRCEPVSWFPAQFPNSLAAVAKNQIQGLDEANAHRKKIAAFYKRSLPDYEHPPMKDHIFLRYPLRSKHRDELIEKARRHGVFLGNWYTSVVAPQDSDLASVDYRIGQCKTAERMTKEIFNLPTHRGINLKKAQEIVDLIS